MTKVKKVFAMQRSQNAKKVGSDFKLMVYIVDYLPLKDLIRIGRINMYFTLFISIGKSTELWVENTS